MTAAALGYINTGLGIVGTGAGAASYLESIDDGVYRELPDEGQRIIALEKIGNELKRDLLTLRLKLRPETPEPTKAEISEIINTTETLANLSERLSISLDLAAGDIPGAATQNDIRHNARYYADQSTNLRKAVKELETASQKDQDSRKIPSSVDPNPTNVKNHNSEQVKIEAATNFLNSYSQAEGTTVEKLLEAINITSKLHPDMTLEEFRPILEAYQEISRVNSLQIEP